jgi:hypothetical protein
MKKADDIHAAASQGFIRAYLLPTAKGIHRRPAGAHRHLPWATPQIRLRDA